MARMEKMFMIGNDFVMDNSVLPKKSSNNYLRHALFQYIVYFWDLIVNGTLDISNDYVCVKGIL